MENTGVEGGGRGNIKLNDMITTHHQTNTSTTHSSLNDNLTDNLKTTTNYFNNNNNNTNTNSSISIQNTITPPPPPTPTPASTIPQSVFTTSNTSDQLDNNLSNLWINSNWNNDVDDALLDQYEKEAEKLINENLLIEKEQSSQRLFQSFQTSACAVAQMFKDKTQPPQTPWESFQNSAGAITVLYKDSLEACKAHLDLGMLIGQQRKVKEILNWLKKKKRRNIRKDELIGILIGKPINTNTSTSIFACPPANNTSFVPSLFNSSNTNANNNQTQASQQFGSSLFSQSQSRRQQISRQQQQQQSQQQQQQQNQLGRIGTTLNNINLNSNANSNSNNTAISGDTNSDLATFREALIMHNRSRDTPFNHHQQHHHHHNHIHHQHHNHNHYNNSTNNNNTANLSLLQQQQANCDDLDCFFCEQIATHIEHKRSASSLNSNMNFDMESPTRKKSRFY